MANMSPVALIVILVVCVIIALLLGAFIGSRLGGQKSTAMKEEKDRHESYKNEVREHFEHTSAIMSRMVDDYRDMYQHMSNGAEKLADMHEEKLVTPPPAPEAITRDDATGSDAPQDNRQAAEQADGSTGAEESGAAASDRDSGSAAGATKPSTPTSASREAVMTSDSSNDRPWNKEGGDKKYGLE